MHSVLLIAEQSDTTQPHDKALWLSLLRRVGQIAQQDKTIQILSDDTWQIALDHGLQSFVAIVSEIQDAGVQYRALFFEDAPKWVCSQNS